MHRFSFISRPVYLFCFLIVFCLINIFNSVVIYELHKTPTTLNSTFTNSSQQIIGTHPTQVSFRRLSQLISSVSNASVDFAHLLFVKPLDVQTSFLKNSSIQASHTSICTRSLKRIQISKLKRSEVLNHYDLSVIENTAKLYRFCESIPKRRLSKNVTISLTAIPKQWSHIPIAEEVLNTANLVIHIPKSYRFYDYSENDLLILRSKYPNMTVHLMDVDYGPASKLVGLCSMRPENINDYIIYIDSDVKYDVQKLMSMTEYAKAGRVFANAGGFFPDFTSMHPSIGWDLVEWAYNTPKYFTPSEIVFGFSGVILTKSMLKDFCESSYRHTGFDCDDCFMIDDEWLSWSYRQLGWEIISSRINHPVVDVSLSDSDINSNRRYYQPLKKRCIPCMQQAKPRNDTGVGISNGVDTSVSSRASKTFRQTLRIASVFIPSNDLHPSQEYLSSIKMFSKNHYLFAIEHNIPYKVYTIQKTEKTHWMKISIIHEFLHTCRSDERLFFTDIDFYFLNAKFPDFPVGKSLIMARGCEADYVHLMVGNSYWKCDKDMIELVKIWKNTTKVMSEIGEFNDDQIAFQLVAPRFRYKIHVYPFMAYDFCSFDPKDVIGIHFPGEHKTERLERFKQLWSGESRKAKLKVKFNRHTSVN